MKHIHKITLFSLLFLFYSPGFSQVCDRVETIEICDMTIVDSDGVGVADGILNLYNEYLVQFPTAPALQNGTWISVNTVFQPALSNNGDLRLWDLPKATSIMTPDDEKYTFELRNVECGADIAMTLELILGPYSGETLPQLPSGANVEICDTQALDLYNTLFTSEPTGVPAAHQNGSWAYDGVSPNITIDGPIVRFDIPDDINVTIDQETFQFTYTVSGINPCSSQQSTTVKVSAIRQPDAGEGSSLDICEDEMKAGVYDADINLEDFITDQDPNGTWSTTNDFTNQLSDANDVIINLREMYDDVIARNGIRFSSEAFSFSYTVRDRSNKCIDDVATVLFTFHEEIRPFSQDVAPPEFCSNVSNTFNLYDLITFGEEFDALTGGNLLFEYSSDDNTDWTLVSTTASPQSDLRLLSQNEVDPSDPTRMYNHLGTIFVGNDTNPTAPGTYVYRYTVFGGVCPDLSTEVTIIINPFDYAGENTPISPNPIPTIDNTPEFCESLVTIDLQSVLESNGDPIATTGVWTDETGAETPNDFVIPEIDNQQDFSFTYTTLTDKGCTDNATLTIRIFEEPESGIGSDATICREDGTFDLFTLLEGADQTGFWTGPIGFNSKVDDDFSPHLGHINLLDNWQSGEYKYTVPENGACVAIDEISTTIILTIVEPVNAGLDINNGVFCKSEGQINLFDQLDLTTNVGGEFIDNATSLPVTDGAFVFGDLPGGVYNFTYNVSNGDCTPASATIGIRIIDVQIPDEILPSEFCILDAATLGSIETVNYIGTDGEKTSIDNIVWYANPEGDDIVPMNNTLLIDGQKLYVAAQGENGCESERLEVTISILNLGEKDCTLEFQDGVSPDTSGDNDTFNITDWKTQVFNIPTVFDNFELLIYNRYGTLVYKANKNTEEFRGVGNAGLQLGKNLPSGVYFYVLNPNKNENRPIQGNFYLSK